MRNTFNPQFPDSPFFVIVDIFPGPLTGVPLSNCPLDQFGSFNLCFKFSSGTFACCGGTQIVKSSLEGGFAGVEFTNGHPFPEGHSFITASILPGLGTTGGSVSASWPFFDDRVGPLRGGLNLHIGLTPIPEPGMLGLLGTSLFGLAGMMRRKGKLGT